jgi:hypothetical protein
MTIIIIFAFALCGFIISSLIYFLDYYPFTKIQLNDGFCKNTKTYLSKYTDSAGKRRSEFI